MAMTTKQKQWQLYYLGYYGSSVADIDGIWGPKSIAATQLLQKHGGIKVDGIFGVSTENKSREIIDAIQDVLIKYAGALVNDGLAGPATANGTKVFQNAKGLPQTGVVDMDTWNMLMAESSYDEEHSEIVRPSSDPPASNTPTTSSPSGTPATSGTFWDDIKYFTRDELRCKCGGHYCNGFPAEPQELLVRLAERARNYFGAPAHNVSCLRCRQHNANSGGVANSQHMYGEAMDIRITGVSGDRLLAFFTSQPEVRYTYKINDTNVHFDIPKRAR